MSVCVLAAAVFTAAALGDATTVKVRGTVTTASKESKATEWALWAQVGLAAVAALTLPAIFLQVRTGRKDAAADRTATLHSEFGHRNFQKVFSPSLAYLDLDLGETRPLADKVRDCVEKIRAWETMPHAEAHRLPRTPRDPSSPHACKNDVDNIAGFFEVLSQRYNQKDIQRDSVARSMGPNLVVYFVTASWWIHWQRAAARENAVFGEWEQTVNALRHPRGRRFRPRHPTYAAITRVDPKLPIRAICVPPKPADASDDDWSFAANLSIALAREGVVDRKDIPVRKRVAEVHSDGDWLVVLMPESLDTDRETQRWNRGLAVAIERIVADLSPQQRTDALTRLATQHATEALGADPSYEDLPLWRVLRKFDLRRRIQEERQAGPPPVGRYP